MKSRMAILAAVFMASVTIFSGSSYISAAASPLQAGISATITECLGNSTEQLAIEEKSKDQVKVSKKEAEQETAKKEAAKKEAAKKKKNAGKEKEDATQKIYGYVNLGIADVNDYLNVRSLAEEDSEVVGRMDKQDACEILKEKDGWYKVRSGDVQGFVKQEYIITGKKAKKAADKQVKTIATVNTETLYVREEPNKKCSILRSVASGDQLRVKNDDEKWVEVKLGEDTGYVSAKYVDVEKVLDTAETMEQIEKEAAAAAAASEDGTGTVSASSSGNAGLVAAQTALQYVGNPYVWGGTSLTNGIDCSGFTMQIMAKFGVYLPHFAASQAAYGVRVSTSELQPGDLIFYGNGITHVAIYIGGGQIVHASNSRDGIKVSNAFYSTPVCCRRVL